MENNTCVKIAETYIKLNLDFNEYQNQDLRTFFVEIIKKSEHLNTYVEKLQYRIEFDKGSTKVRITFFGFLTTFIVGYAELANSIRTLYNDVKNVSEFIINHAVEKNLLIEKNILNTQKRTGIIGKLRLILNRIELIQNEINNLEDNQNQEELNALYQEISDLIQVLSYNDQQLFIAQFNQIGINLPQPNQNVNIHLRNLYAIEPEKFIPDL